MNLVHTMETYIYIYNIKAFNPFKLYFRNIAVRTKSVITVMFINKKSNVKYI